MLSRNRWIGRGVTPLPRVALAVGVLAFPLAGCDDLLVVTDPDIADPANFTDATALAAIQAGAIGDFAVAYSGEGQVLYSGLLGDEWISSGTFPTRVEVDIRNISEQNATLQGVTRNLYRARSSAEEAILNFEQLGPNTAGHAQVLNLAAVSTILFGENYCSGVPFSRLTPEGTFEFGERQTTVQLFEQAVERADRAIAAATAAGASGTAQLNLARVLKGRALVNLGRYAEAATAVAQVPTAYLAVVEHSENTGREQNGIFNLNVLFERWSVASNEGGEGLPYRSNGDDPRTPWRRVPANDVGFDRVTAQYDQLKYLDRSAPVPVANGVEARLIEAEAALNANNTARFIELINDVRDQFGLDEVALPATRAAQVDLLFRERAYSLWLTSHRLGDMRRLIRQYGRPANEVFPTGQYHKSTQGGVYGNDVNLPLPVDERNNPNLNDPNANLCLDRNA